MMHRQPGRNAIEDGKGQDDVRMECATSVADDVRALPPMALSVSAHNIHPLFLLENFLRDLSQQQKRQQKQQGYASHASGASAGAALMKTDEEWTDEIIRVCHFLFGNMLSAALALLDTSERIITKIETGHGTSYRSYFLVRGSKQWNGRYKSSSSFNPPNPYMAATGDMPDPASLNANAQQDGPFYLCIIPNPDTDVHARCYSCSCRSYLEKAKGTDRCPVAPRICKHLLALMLLPHLPNVKHQTITTSTEEEFTNLILQRTIR